MHTHMVHHRLLQHSTHLLVHHSAHLLLIIFNESWFIHGDTVLSLDLVAVMHEKGFVTRQFFLNGLDRHLVDRLAYLQCIHSLKQLFGDVQDILGEQGPLWLWIYQGWLCIFFLLLKDDIVSLHEHQLLLEFLCVSWNPCIGHILPT